MGIRDILSVASFVINLFSGPKTQSMVVQPQQCTQCVYEAPIELSYAEKTPEQMEIERVQIHNYLERELAKSNVWMKQYLANLPK